MSDQDTPLHRASTAARVASACADNALPACLLRALQSADRLHNAPLIGDQAPSTAAERAERAACEAAKYAGDTRSEADDAELQP